MAWPSSAGLESESVGAIFLRHGDSFVSMREQPYEAEALLQALIAEHPEILADDESGERSAWVLVKREAGVADSEEGADRWSLDHLFLDQAGVPTLVEVKRSSDTRTRRGVVAQMLDYAANATAHWNVESLRTWFEAECERRSVDPQTKLSEAFGVADIDDYWETVKTNLAAERIRLVFVSDKVPAELRSIIEFLNRQMSETEVFAIEVKQYVDVAGERQTIVPRVLGRTEAAKAAKSGRRRATRQWDETSLVDEIARLHGSDVAAVARSLIAWAGTRPDVRVDYGQGPQSGSAQFKLLHEGATLLTAFNIWSDGRVGIMFDYMHNQAPFADSREKRDELRRRINEAVPTANIPSEEQRRRPTFSLRALADEPARQGFIAAMAWAFDAARKAQTGQTPDPGSHERSPG
jgi:hypothetical protein